MSYMGSNYNDATNVIHEWQKNNLKSRAFAVRFWNGVLIFNEILEGHEEEHLKGYAFGKHHSVGTLEGELGDANRSTSLAIIPEVSFLAAMENGWSRSFTRFK